MRKSVAIFGEGPTEWHYIDSLRIARRYPFTMKPSMPQHSDMGHMLAQAKKCISEGYDEVICLLDMDRLRTTPSEMQKYLKAKKQTAFRKVTFIETDPCTEYWFLLHFRSSVSQRDYASYEAVVVELRKYMPNYEKTENFFRRTNLFNFLSEHGDLDHAIELARRSTELHDEGGENSYSQMHLLFKKLDEFSK